MGRVGFSKKLKSDPESWNSLERHSTEKPISKIIKCGLENQQKKKKISFVDLALTVPVFLLKRKMLTISIPFTIFSYIKIFTFPL